MSKNQAAPKGSDLATNNAIAYQEEMDGIMENNARNLDDLAIHDELMNGILGAVRADITKGVSAEDILKKYSQFAAARMVTIATTDADSGRALSASKDIMDRTMGKARETKDITHRLDKVDERQIDAILLTELEALEFSDGQEADDE